MRRSYKYIAGASAAVLVAVGAAGLYGPGAQLEGEPPVTSAPVAALVAKAAPMPGPALPEAPAPAEIAARIDDLTTRLADREAELAIVVAGLGERDARLDALTATLSRREAEIQALRDELAGLRERYAFDVELEALKGQGGVSPATLEGPAPVETVAASLETAPVAVEPSVLALTRIHFETGSSSLTPGGQVHAAAAAVMLAEMPVLRVRLLGYADRVGRADRNRALAAARAQAVADFLVRSGVPSEVLEPAGMGEDDLPVLTGDGVAEPLNRSVAIVAIPRPTS